MTDAGPNVPDSFGEEKLTHRASAFGYLFAFKLLAIGTAGATCVLAGIGPFAMYSLVPRLVLGTLAGLIGLLGLAFLLQMRHTYYLFTNGVAWGKQQLSFDEIESLACTLKPPPKRHSHLPTAIDVTYTPFPETDKKFLRFNCGGDQAFITRYLHALDNLTGKIASRMQESLDTTGRAAWTPQVTFTREGLETIPKDGFPVLLPYEYAIFNESGKVDLSKANELRDSRSGEAFAKFPVGAANLLAGTKLMLKLAGTQEVSA